MYNETVIFKPEPILPNLTGSTKLYMDLFDLPGLIRIMKHEHTWKEGELNSMILLESPAKKILLTILHKDTEIVSHQENDSITLYILEGKLKLHFRKESYSLNQGETMTLNEKVKYRIDSLEESAFLLTLASGD